MNGSRIFLGPESLFRGGPKTFLSNFKRYLKRIGIETAVSLDHADHLFLPFPASSTIPLVREARSRGKGVFARIDGAYFRGTTVSIGAENAAIREVLETAKGLIFQSEFSRSHVQSSLEPSFMTRNQVVIRNGADAELFFVEFPHKQPRGSIRIVSTGRFRHSEMLVPILDGLESFALQIPIKLTIIGPVEEQFRSLLKRPFVTWLGELSAAELAYHLRRADVFVYAFANAPCPNSVVEAAACGIPIVTFDTGGIPEILEVNRDLLVSMPAGLHRESDFDAYALRCKVMTCVRFYDRYKQVAVSAAPAKNFELTGAAYLEAFDRWTAAP